MFNKKPASDNGAFLADGDRFRLFESVLDQVHERIYIVGTDYRYRYANQRVFEFDGWNAEEILGQHVVDLVGPLIFRRLVKPRLDRCFRGEDVSFQHWITARSGQRQYIDVLLAPFRDWGGAIVGAIVTIREKTAQKELEEELRDQVDLYRQLIENAVVGIAFLEDRKIVFANQAMTTMFGYGQADDMLRQIDPLNFVAPHDRERIRHLEFAYENGQAIPRIIQFDGVSGDGRFIHVVASISVVKRQGKRIIQLIIIDRTKQREAKQTLEAVASSFKDVVDGSLQGFFVTQDSHFVHVNQAFIDLLGYSEEELKSAPVVMFYAQHERERMNSYRLRRLEKSDAPHVYEVDAVHKDGRVIRLQQCVRQVEDWFGQDAILGFVFDVTSSHLSKKALQEERNLLRAIIDNIPAVVFAKDRDGKFLIKNKTGAAFVGETNPASMIGKDNSDYYPEDLVNTFRANELQVMASGEPLIDENQVIRPATGETVTMSGCVAPLQSADDEIIGIVGVSHDITKHRRSEEALRESEQRFKDIAEVTSDWFWEMDADLRFSYFSDRTAELSGTDVDATLGMKRSEIDIEMNDGWKQHFDDLENRRSFRDFRYVKQGNDGKTYHISISGVPVFDNDGIFKGYRGAGTNITKEVEAQQALANERNLLRAIVDNIPDIIYAKDLQARFILKNQADAELMGAKTPDETIGKSDFDYFPAALAAKFFRDDLQVIDSGTPIINKVEHLVRSDNGEAVLHSTTKVPLRDEDGEIMGLVGIGRDITEAKRLTDRLHHQATHDCLTGLLNRGEFERRLEQTLDAAKSTHSSAVLCYIDLDQFKMVNDSAGHLAGDQLLQQLANLFKEQADAKGAVLARLGGDEFGLLIEDCMLKHGERMAKDLIDAVSAIRFLWEQRSFSVSISVGITVINERIRNVSDLLARADVACYAAKDNGRNQLCVYRASDQETRVRHEELIRAASLKQAIDNDRLLLVAQPIARLGETDTSISHYEILLRLKGRDDELLSPGAFIPAAERYGLMPMIDQWVVREALKILGDIAKPVDGRRFNINLSGHSLTDGVFQDALRRMLIETTIPAESLCFEITETAVISNLSRAMRFVGELREIGCRIALDDFGCGLSSFSYLKQFPVDYIKIDGSFVKKIAVDQTDRAIVEAINHVAHISKVKTVAECVEEDSLIGPLLELQIDYAQGFAIGPPQPIHDVLANIEVRVSMDR
ncbi:MAG: PAS domain S-box protein [Geminicoccales bacterium]